MRIGYSTWSMFTIPYQVFLPRLHEIGYTSIALNVSPGGGRRPNANDLAGLTADDTRRIKEECEQRGMELSAVCGNRSLLARDREEARANMQRLRDTIDFCVEVAPRGQPLPTMNTTSGGRSTNYEEDRQLLVERLGELAEYARGRGVVIGLEAHCNTIVRTPERVEWVLGTVNSPHCRLDYDSSHFEVQLVPMETVVPRVVPWTASVEIKDQRVRYGDEPTPKAWRIEGNGIDHARSPDGRPVEFQWVMGGEGDHDLVRWLRLMQQAGWTGAVCYEVSVQCQARPDFDGPAAAERTYRWMAEACEQAGISTD